MEPKIVENNKEKSLVKKGETSLKNTDKNTYII